MVLTLTCSDWTFYSFRITPLSFIIHLSVIRFTVNTWFCPVSCFILLARSCRVESGVLDYQTYISCVFSVPEPLHGQWIRSSQQRRLLQQLYFQCGFEEIHQFHCILFLKTDLHLLLKFQSSARRLGGIDVFKDVIDVLEEKLTL